MSGLIGDFISERVFVVLYGRVRCLIYQFRDT